MRIERCRCTAALLSGLLLAGFAGSSPATAQTQPGCGPDGTRAISRRWDAVLGVGWELRQDCAHPEWPARLLALGPSARVPAVAAAIPASAIRMIQVAQTIQPQPQPPQTQMVVPAPPLLIHAGDSVKLWMQDEKVRIEMTGVAEQGARSGERVMVRITQQTEDAGITVQHIAGIVRSAGDVEMER